jgi:hypothetical protein
MISIFLVWVSCCRRIGFGGGEGGKIIQFNKICGHYEESL